MARTASRIRTSWSLFGSGSFIARSVFPESVSLQNFGVATSQATRAAYAAPPSARMGQDCSAAAPRAPLPATIRFTVPSADRASTLGSCFTSGVMPRSAIWLPPVVSWLALAAPQPSESKE